MKRLIYSSKRTAGIKQKQKKLKKGGGIYMTVCAWVQALDKPRYATAGAVESQHTCFNVSFPSTLHSHTHTSMWHEHDKDNACRKAINNNKQNADLKLIN